MYAYGKSPSTSSAAAVRFPSLDCVTSNILQFEFPCSNLKSNLGFHYVIVLAIFSPQRPDNAALGSLSTPAVSCTNLHHSCTATSLMAVVVLRT